MATIRIINNVIGDVSPAVVLPSEIKGYFVYPIAAQDKPLFVTCPYCTQRNMLDALDCAFCGAPL